MSPTAARAIRLGAVTIAVWPAFAARHASPRPLILGVCGSAAVTAVFVALLGWLLAETRDGSVLGLAERLTSSIQTCWPFIVAVAPRRTRHPRHRSRAIAPLAAAVAGLSRQGAGFGWAAGVLARTVAGLLADAGLPAACFGLAGLPVPWRGLLFAYAAGQLAGRLVPLPGGLGSVEGGVLGALTLTGTRPAAAAAAVIVYRVAGYWAVGAAGTASSPAASGLH